MKSLVGSGKKGHTMKKIFIFLVLSLVAANTVAMSPIGGEPPVDMPATFDYCADVMLKRLGTPEYDTCVTNFKQRTGATRYTV